MSASRLTIASSFLWVSVGLAALAASGCGSDEGATGTDPLTGCAFEVIGELYAYEVAKDLNNRKADLISIVPLRLSGPEILSSRLVSLGSRLSVAAREPKRWPTFLYPDRYVVRLDSISF